MSGRPVTPTLDTMLLAIDHGHHAVAFDRHGYEAAPPVAEISAGPAP